ncbi:MAG: PQQ-binding-like beta-propeller repeat protein [Acidimicrobiales bacterium]|nr:PQQ-binding-like beta-propeller repeat protein [Acidimicrobiales bacterium]
MMRPILILLALLLVAAACSSSDGSSAEAPTAQGDSGDTSTPTDPQPDAAADASDDSASAPVWVGPGTEGLRWSGLVPGVLTFRGNPTRTYYGSGPVPTAPQVVWRRSGYCAPDPETGEQSCGSGWASQPAVFERSGRTWLVAATMDGKISFLDADTGEDLLPPFQTDGPIKGTVTIDPEGFPLAYIGSQDGRMRVISFDRERPTELWSVDGDDFSPVLFSDDWDGAPLVLEDYLFAGGENGALHVFRLNRSTDSDGIVAVAPELVFFGPTWDDQLLADIGDENVSVETSVAVVGDTLYLANSAGRVQGWDIGPIRRGEDPTVVFQFWTGDDTDASVVVDDAGYVYVGSDYERFNERAARVGQVLKLDSTQPDDPVVWSVNDADPTRQSGPIGTPAVSGSMVYASTAEGRLLGVDRTTGDVVWEKTLGGKLWGSPVVVDGVLLQGDCDGGLWAFDVSDQSVDPPQLWRTQLNGCIESTPTVWRGRIYVGTRAGELYALG